MKFAVIGSPIDKSLSPQLHEILYKELNISNCSWALLHMTTARSRKPSPPFQTSSLPCPGCPSSLSSHSLSISLRCSVSNTTPCACTLRLFFNQLRSSSARSFVSTHCLRPGHSATRGGAVRVHSVARSYTTDSVSLPFWRKRRELENCQFESEPEKKKLVWILFVKYLRFDMSR